MSRVQYFEMHQEQVGVMRFFHVIRSLLKYVHYDSFTLEDLLQPRECPAGVGSSVAHAYLDYVFNNVPY